MSWSFRIARIAGIEVKIHFTFLLLLGWFGLDYYRLGGLAAAVEGISFILLLFLCVLLHEFGHAMAARYYGIRTPDITLLPIGGVARLERMPSSPVQELVVAVAGPAVNVVIILLLGLFVGPFMGFRQLGALGRPDASIAQLLMAVNMMLVIFNLIPAFPMDGGRILRALLATQMSHARATVVAARVGQGVAVLFVLWGIYTGNYLLMFIALFVFMGAQQEALFARMQTVAAGMRVADCMVSRFWAVPEDANLGQIRNVLEESEQGVFPVTDSFQRMVGWLFRDKALAVLSARGEEVPVSELIEPAPVHVFPSTSCEEALRVMQEEGAGLLPAVNASGQLVGIVSLGRLREMAR